MSDAENRDSAQPQAKVSSMARTTKDIGVTALPGDQRPQDAMKYLAEACSGGAIGVIVAVVDSNGDVEPRAFGTVTLNQLARASAILGKEAAR